MTAVAFYISGHGLGHASRQIEIINALGRRLPRVAILVRTSAPRWLFDRTVSLPVTLIDDPCDTGVVQIDSLHLDADATISCAARFHHTLDARAVEEARLLRKHRVSFVVSDAPPLACAAAAEAGLPSVVVSNFTWDWIYEEYQPQTVAPELLPTIQRAYRLAEGAWRLPMHGGFSTFRTITDVPFIARHAAHAPEDTKQKLGLAFNRRLALSSFGGYGVDGLDLSALDCLDAWDVIVTGREEAARRPPDGVRYLDEGNLYGQGLRYEDLVRAVDVVVTKPGYGIISECIANGTGMLYTARGQFAEYPVLVRGMPRYLRCGYLDNDRLLRGAWVEALDAVVARPAAPEAPPTNGADVVAEMIEERL